MSMHEIEDIIEETVHLINNADLPPTKKRDHLYNLYKLEYYFDTSYTHFRVIDILLKYKYVYRLPLETHPEYKKATSVLDIAEIDEYGGWVKSPTEEFNVYGKKEEGEIFLYGDAGSAIWEAWVNAGVLAGDNAIAPARSTVPETVLAILQLAEAKKNKTLLNEWYAFFANGVLEFYFGENENVSKDFIALSSDPVIIAVRNIAQQNELGKKRKKNGEEAFLLLPSLLNEVRLTNTTDAEYRAKLFLDLKKDLPSLISAYKKSSISASDVEIKVSNIKKAIQDDFPGWHFISEEGNAIDKIKWQWYNDGTDKYGTHRLFILVEYDADLKIVVATLAFQHALILKWQQRKLDDKLSHTHFNYNLVGFLPDEETEKNKLISNYGGWKYDVKKSEKVLAKSLQDFTSCLKKGTEAYFEFVTSEFPDTYFTRNADEMIEEFEGFYISKNVLVDSRYYIPLLFYFYFNDKGDKVKSTVYIQRAKELGEQCKKMQRDDFLQPFFDAYNAGKNPALP